MKIAYCTDSICYAGGIQRVTIAKANKLALKNEVWIIVTDNKDKPVFPLSTKVHLVNCDINYFEDDWKSRFYILKGIIYKRKQHKKRLKEILNQIQPDIVISTGTSEKNFLPYLSVSSHPVFIREIHSNKNYRSLHAQSVFDKLLAILGDFIDYRIHLKKYDRTVVLTKEDKVVHWGKNTEVDVCVIPNPIISFGSKKASLINKKVIAVGRLAFPKNFSSLISAWKYVIERHADWTLEIWGEGELRTELEEQIRNNQLTNNIFLKGYTYDIFSPLYEASIFTLTSLFEGLPLVIIEAMSCGVPVVSYACPCGPQDIIAFIDGDDYIHPQMYEVLLEALQEGNYSFSMILGKQVYDNDKSYSIPSAYTKSILTQEIMIKSLFNHIHPQQGIKEVQAQVVWNKLYKRELLDNEFFQETGTEDTEFNCRIYQKSCQAVIIDIPMYYWVQRPTSITHQKVNPRYIDRADSYYLCLQNIPKENTVYRGCCLEKLFKMIINVRYHASNTPYRHLAHLTAKRLKKQTANEFLKNRHIPFHIKLSLLSFYYIPPLYSGFMKLCETKARKK